MTRLPRSLDELRGRRAARWIRESTTGQFDRYGPDAQRDRQAEFIERWGLVDTGIEYSAAHSGRTVWRSPAMAAMLEAAGRDFDVILVGYFDRWQRNTRRTLELVEDRLHPQGAAWVMCDRRLLSSDPRDWREMRRLSSEAEEYSEKLGERITDGYAAKFRRLADQAGSAPLGFRRSSTPPHVLELDPSSIGRAVRVFERYAGGSLSMRELAAEHLANRLTDDAYLEQLGVLRAELAEAERPRRSSIDVDKAIAAIADMASLWQDATAEQRAQLAHAVYARIPVLRERFLPVTLTPAAYEIGLDQAMAELVRVAVVSPAGTRATRATRRIPILGRRERLLTARRSA